MDAAKVRKLLVLKLVYVDSGCVGGVSEETPQPVSLGPLQEGELWDKVPGMLVARLNAPVSAATTDRMPVRWVRWADLQAPVVWTAAPADASLASQARREQRAWAEGTAPLTCASDDPAVRLLTSPASPRRYVVAEAGDAELRQTLWELHSCAEGGLWSHLFEVPAVEGEGGGMEIRLVIARRGDGLLLLDARGRAAADRAVGHSKNRRVIDVSLTPDFECCGDCLGC